ncbi:LCP family protein [Listeria ivanovii]|uniref:Putative transcriptional regulator LytR n=1 Tax=Listeria ivanovii (strain ATCC BAA-678 / PAM 55) TaxID=881621 RepID=G2ZFF5_LISIP|nr:LCP family protein [Listeria ivanovii]AHI56943.1 LytR family transcriptional regulator [Listeria ivanovii WSLC3009]AIS66359.1 transcriptional regulator [Listeria ivanovii subsp. ivanovii]MBC1759839.1 LCP family protein [Listeria ivanovii]MBK3915086.1 LCP family protein [Listeria ivanovii subsp. ivanovii]MBK3922290.1 LCP family protein [Listeria ivanovii subsp. ivanovii]
MNKGTDDSRKSSKKYKRRRKILFWILIPIMCLVLAGVGYGTYLFSKTKLAADNSFDNVRNGEASTLRSKDIEPIKDSFSILIIGVDTSAKRESDGNPRSDSLILATFNVKDSRVEMTSIPRDSYVHIQDSKKDIDKYTKINAAHAYGGPELTMRTVEEEFKIPIDYYVRFDFDAFLKIVDALGGIDVDVPVSFTEQDSNDKAGAITLEKGQQHLNGEQALALARTRHIDSDIERGKRQQLIIKSIVSEATSISSISKYSDIIKVVGDNMKTNLTFNQMLSIAKFGMTNSIDIKSLNLEGTDAPMNGIYYYQLNDDSVQSVSNEFADELGIKKPFPNAAPYSDKKSTTTETSN